MTKLDVMLWNKDHTESVRASKIRSFGIYQDRFEPMNQVRWKLLGWYNKDEFFHFGFWDAEIHAQNYLARIHDQIEGRS